MLFAQQNNFFNSW